MKRTLATVLSLTFLGILSLTAQVRIFTPELSSPADDAINQVPNVTLDWNAVTGGNTGIIYYDVQLDTDPAFPAPVNFETEFVSAVEATELIFGQEYFWRVRARDGDDVSDWSETWSFKVVKRVSLSKPLDAAASNTDVTLEWLAMTGIEGYELQVDTNGFWKSMSGVTATTLNAVKSLDETHAWMVGAGGLVLFYDGSTVTEQTSSVSTDLLGVDFVDASNGWAVGKGGKIIHFDGTEWTEQTSGTSNDLYGVSFTDASNGWAAGKSGVILKYDGTSWSEQFMGSKDLYAINIFSATSGLAVGKAGYILRFNGSQWTEQTSGTTRDLFAVALSGESEGWAMGKAGTILHLMDGNWSSFVTSLTTKDMVGISFASSQSGWAVGKSGVVLEFDGADWFNQTAGTSSNFTAVSLNSAGGFSVGENGLVAAYNTEAFSNPTHDGQFSSSTTVANVLDLDFGSTYFWRVRTEHGQAVSEFSGARSVVTASTVALDKPNNNSTDQNLDLLLKWKKLSDRVSYNIEIDDDPGFGNPINMETDEGEITAEMLKFNTQYNWRVRAFHAFDVSEWSAPYKFTTVEKVKLSAPANGATDVKLTPILEWLPLTGIEEYNVQFNSDNGFNGGEMHIDTIINADQPIFIVPVVLGKETMYYWRVRAVNGLDTSNWSDTWSFTTLPPVGIGEPGNNSRLSVYPNPASDKVWISIDGPGSNTVNIHITDLLGKSVIEETLFPGKSGESVAIDISSLRKGIYMVRVASDNEIHTGKLVIDR